MTINQVWTEKYRPQNIESVILNDEDKQFFSSLKEIPNNLLLVGSPGIGKTTIAKILANSFSPNSYLYINASEQGNIETVRTLISDFISVSSIDGSVKTVILDEADGVSLVAQQALRSIMEEYLDSVKFILTANYRNKLIEALRSRCQEFFFSCTQKQIRQRVVEILKSEKIVFDKSQIENLRNLITDHFPDIRKTINELQKCCISGSFVYCKNGEKDISLQIKEKLSNNVDIFEIRQFVMDSADIVGNDFHSLMKSMFSLYVKECNTVACILISEYMYRHSFVLDAEINFSALLFNLKNKMQM